jgi:ferredoxin
MIPLFTIAGGLILYNSAPVLARIHSVVRLAQEIQEEKVTGVEAVSLAAIAYKESGQTEDELFASELAVISRFRRASPWAGIFLGLALGIALVSMTTKKTRTEYKPHQGKCYSCGRCFKFCPVDVNNRIK